MPLIEQGVFSGAAIEDAVARYSAPLKEAGVDTVLLSCTHYPFIRAEIEKGFGEDVTVLDPAEATALQARIFLERAGLLKMQGTGRSRICFTADLNRGKAIAERMLDMERSSFEEISLL